MEDTKNDSRRPSYWQLTELFDRRQYNSLSSELSLSYRRVRLLMALFVVSILKFFIFVILNVIIYMAMKELIHFLPSDRMPSLLCQPIHLHPYKHFTENYQNITESTVIYNVPSIQFIEAGRPCSISNPSQYLTVCIVSRTSSYERRDVIRKTWASNSLHGRVNFVFFLGVPREKFESTSELKLESERHRDIVIIDYEDTYRNLTFKSVSVLKWCFQYCAASKYILKIDEDVFIDIPRLLDLLYSIRVPRVILGYLLMNNIPVRDVSSKSFLPKRDYLFDRFPAYVTGASYVISVDLLPVMLKAVERSPTLPPEDVFVTGICGTQAGATLLGHCGFSYVQETVRSWSFLSLINGHEFTAGEMEEIWSVKQALFDLRHNWLKYRQFSIM